MCIKVIHQFTIYLEIWQASKRQELEKKKERKHKLHVLMKKIEFEEQTCRNFAHLKQQEIEIRAYEGKYGKVSIKYNSVKVKVFSKDRSLAQRV